MSSGKKVLTVFGATGNQGGAIINTILGDSKASSEFQLRGITRDVTRPKSKALSDKGVEMVAGDTEDPSSLRDAIKGAYGVFAMTNYWDKMDHELELQQGKAIADMCKEEGVQHLIWSSLFNVKELSKGALPHVYHWDSKAQVEQYIRDIGIPATFLMPGFFMSNIPGSNLRRGEDGKFVLAMAMPDNAQVPLWAPELDTGKVAKAIWLKRDQVLGKRILAATDYVTPKQMLESFQKVFPEAGKGAHFVELTEDQFKGALKSRGTSEFIAQELYENMRVIPEFGYYGGDSLDFSHSILDDKLTTWEEFVKAAPAFKDLK
ncbi:NmrA-domain-containing protein [Rhizodiscina lignyota]|uniref:NmrA-domain-containing protein n=1 Tax=Rhizodiscina lignyota TaxID=1504668 RepID=A0A9P4ID75_9PEZI|nr:NmrA-domain-containing protein [Rhizodiscina lignyota]